MHTPNLDRLFPVARTAYKTHVVQRGETLSSICRKYRLSRLTLLKANDLRNATLQPGQRLFIPYRKVHYILLAEGQRRPGTQGGPGQALVLHQVQPGETLGQIGRRYNVPPELIRRWNGLASIHRIRAGQQLALYLGEGIQPRRAAAPAAAPAKADRSGTRWLVLADRKKVRPGGGRAAVRSEKRGGVAYYRVRRGDSLWTIGRRFNVSPAKLRQWNNLRSNLIHPGTVIIVRKG